MEDLVITTSTHVEHVQWIPAARELRVAVRGADGVVRWYAYSQVPRSCFDDLRAQEEGARRQGRGFPKGAKPYSVGTYYNQQVKDRYVEVKVDGPWSAT